MLVHKENKKSRHCSVIQNSQFCGNYSKMLQLKFLLGVCLVLSPLDARIVPESLEVESGGGFYLRLEPIVSMTFDTCELIRGNQHIDVKNVSKLYLETGEMLSSFEPEDAELCGIRVLAAGEQSKGPWTLLGKIRK